MATKAAPILGPNTVPDGSGSVFMEPYSAKAANDVWQFLAFVFADTGTRDGLRGLLRVPEDYVGTAQINLYWTAGVTTGNVVWDLDYRAVAPGDAESMDQAGTQESVTVTDASPTAAHNLLKAVLTITDANLSPGDLVEFEIFRDGANASDDMAAAAILFHAELQYSDV